MAGHWPPPTPDPGDSSGNLARWKLWLQANYQALSLQATSTVPWCQVNAMRAIVDAVNGGHLPAGGAADLLRWCVRSSRRDLRELNRLSRSGGLGLHEVLGVTSLEIESGATDADLIRLVIRRREPSPELDRALGD